jgi:hypothetical protein
LWFKNSRSLLNILISPRPMLVVFWRHVIRRSSELPIWLVFTVHPWGHDQLTCRSEEMSGTDSCLCDRCTCNHRWSCGQSSNSARVSDDVYQWQAVTELWSRDTTYTRHAPTLLAGCVRLEVRCNTLRQQCTFFDFRPLLSHSIL